ncbi:MAG: RDD family protein [Paludisphaera borealis]|uniref:RDD family protein n=1 Tax=Paludisphaera borealis TaxID=1387353 RepID=UPI00283F7B0C|nr:RDD family protein [Paludisphaera borealis]MDR3617710.1 RDD family protein [Paludisphaera borealis]
MSQFVEQGVEGVEMDPYDIGWYVESADEETYGPVSRDTLGRWLEEKAITPNTLVNHCTQPEARPIADQAALKDRLPIEQQTKPVVGDRLEEAWPRKTRDRLALGEGSLPCARHKKPATLVCVRCLAPYCGKCRMKPFKKQFFLCRRCQASIFNRRFVALMLDSLLLVYVPMILTVVALSLLGVEPTTVQLAMNIISLAALPLLFFRDSIFGGAGPGKRIMGLRVVQTADGRMPLTHSQGVVRWLSQFIPFFNLYDAAVPYRDPLLRRIGDRWAKTRVLDAPRKLEKAREKVARLLFKKGVQPLREVGLTMEELARIA